MEILLFYRVIPPNGSDKYVYYQSRQQICKRKTAWMMTRILLVNYVCVQWVGMGFIMIRFLNPGRKEFFLTFDTNETLVIP